MNDTRRNLILDLLKRYKENFLNVSLKGPYKEGERANELYKWQLITKCQNKTDAEIIRNFKSINVVHVQTVYPVLTELLKNNQQQLIYCFNGLKDENRSLSERLSIFKKEMGDLCGDKYKSKANDERTAAAFLTCWNPDKYTFFIDKQVYQPYCNYLGEKTYETGEKYPHYLQLLADLVEIIKQDPELIETFQNETNGLIQSDLLIAQNILWQMKDMMKAKENKYINFKHLLEYFVSHLEWCNNNDTSFIGYNTYIKPLLDAKKYKYAGQGWNGDQIQEQIKQWAHYEKYTICINVYGANYQSNACYLNWEGTWINVRPLWDNDHIVKLYISKEEKSSAKEEKTKTIKELGLFDNKEPNSIIKAFFDEYEKMILEYNGLYYNKLMMEQIKGFTQILSIKKNIILQGAPGTGKTYNTAALALSICGETIAEKHEDVMKRYGELQKEGRIGFCTFHQSMDYEDFVEGIKPKTVNEQVSYEIEPGIFKTISKNANNPTLAKQTKSLDAAFDNLVQDIIDGNTKTIKLKNGDESKELSVSPQMTIKWKTGDDRIDVNCVSKDRLLKLCEVYDSKEKIKSMKNINETIRNVIGGCNSSYYWAVANHLFENIVEERSDAESNKNYVLIIDEINRGNVSKIFGELITLLEADKRLGGEHPIKVTLPYSKESFGVPSNLYIIGTMNTTDRSVGNIDYAVRRRFAFVTLESKEEVIEQHYKNDETMKNKALELFNSVKSFLEKHKFDMDIADLMVGHSYFLAKDEEELGLKWKYEIVPLLHEYYKDGITKQDVKADASIDDFCNSK